MLTIEQILSRCTQEQLENILDASLTIMQHMESATGMLAGQLAAENEQFWKLYGINALTFTELAARAHGKQRNVEPIKL